MVRLGDICRFQSGGTPRKSNPEFFGGDIPWITTVALNGGKIDGRDAVDWITDIAIRKSATKVIPRDSILVGTRVGIGKVAINSVPMATNQDVIALTGIDTTIWDKNFLCKFIQSKSDFLISQSRGATIRGIKIETLSCIQVPNIPICEQRRIAAVLDKVSDLIAKRRQQLEKLDELVKARFVEMFGDFGTDKFGWGLRRFGDVCEVLNGYAFKSEKYTDKGVRVIRISNVQNGYIEDNTPVFYPLNDVQVKKYELRENDLLLSLTGNVGRVGLLEKKFLPAVLNQRVACIRLKDDIVLDKLFLFSMLNSDAFEQRCILSSQGVAQKNLSTEWLKNCEISIPPFAEQQRFATYIGQTRKVKEEIICYLEKLTILKNALMQRYFG